MLEQEILEKLYTLKKLLLKEKNKKISARHSRLIKGYLVSTKYYIEKVEDRYPYDRIERLLFLKHAALFIENTTEDLKNLDEILSKPLTCEICDRLYNSGPISQEERKQLLLELAIRYKTELQRNDINLSFFTSTTGPHEMPIYGDYKGISVIKRTL